MADNPQFEEWHADRRRFKPHTTKPRKPGNSGKSQIPVCKTPWMPKPKPQPKKTESNRELRSRRGRESFRAMEKAMEKMPTIKLNPETMDEEGCMRLVKAICAQAANDYRAVRHRERSIVKEEIESFFLSEYFEQLTGLDGEMILGRLKKGE